MRRRTTVALVAALLLSLGADVRAAGARLDVGEDSYLELGFLFQALALWTETPQGEDEELAFDTQFRVRRARIKLSAGVTKWVQAVLQTEIAKADGGTGLDARLLDAYATVVPHTAAQLLVGMHLAPSSRQSLTGAGALLAIDRPGMHNKTITWGTRATQAFSTTGWGPSDTKLVSDAGPRDLGATIFGSVTFLDWLHFKYYVGAYDGKHATDEDDPRLVGRVQLNFFDPEPKYGVSASYLGKLKTIGVGVSYDHQSDIAANATGDKLALDFLEADVFLDMPLGPGALTFEAAYQWLDLSGASGWDHDADAATADRPVGTGSGQGFYAQAGYYIAKVQPWVEYERWFADEDAGSYQILRVGLSYFFSGHNASVKAGYERLFPKSGDDIDTIAVGVSVGL